MRDVMFPPDGPRERRTAPTRRSARRSSRTVRRFVTKEVSRRVAELEHERRFPAEIVAQMRDLGLFGVTIPEEHGGLGLDLLTYIGVIEELA